MNIERQQQLETAIKSDQSLVEIVALLRQYKDQGIKQVDVYLFLDSLHHAAMDDRIDDRILEVADFVAGFCAPHMKVWESEKSEKLR